MFTAIKNRIGRIMVTAIVPLGITFGMADISNAQLWHDPTPAASQHQIGREYTGTLNGASITVRIDQVSGSTISGTVTFATSESPFNATLQGQTMDGQIDGGNYQMPFSATIQGSYMYIDVGMVHVTLTQVA
jgi:hypothetical protein